MECTAALCAAVRAGRSLEKSRGAFLGVSDAASTPERFVALTNPTFISAVNGARVATAAFFKSSRDSMGRSSGGVSRNTCKILLCATESRIGFGGAAEISPAPSSSFEGAFKFLFRFATPLGVVSAAAPKSV